MNDSDTGALIRAKSDALNWNRIEEYYKLFELQDEFMALEGAASESLSKDFEIMRQNVSSRRLNMDELLQFLTAYSRCFGPGSNPTHTDFKNTLI